MDEIAWDILVRNDALVHDPHQRDRTKWTATSRNVEEKFKILDSNKDGKLNIQELQQVTGPKKVEALVTLMNSTPFEEQMSAPPLLARVSNSLLAEVCSSPAMKDESYAKMMMSIFFNAYPQRKVEVLKLINDPLIKKRFE